MKKADPEMLRELFSYEPESGKLFRLTGQNAGKEACSIGNRGYGRVGIGKNFRLLTHRVCWAIFYGEWPVLFIDHINGVKSDNRISNMRLATHANNVQNRPYAFSNKTGFKGVHQLSTGKYTARVCINGVRVESKSFDRAHDAHLLYVRMAKEGHGEFYRE